MVTVIDEMLASPFFSTYMTFVVDVLPSTFASQSFGCGVLGVVGGVFGSDGFVVSSVFSGEVLSSAGGAVSALSSSSPDVSDAEGSLFGVESPTMTTFAFFGASGLHANANTPNAATAETNKPLIDAPPPCYMYASRMPRWPREMACHFNTRHGSRKIRPVGIEGEA